MCRTHGFGRRAALRFRRPRRGGRVALPQPCQNRARHRPRLRHVRHEQPAHPFCGVAARHAGVARLRTETAAARLARLRPAGHRPHQPFRNAFPVRALCLGLQGPHPAGPASHLRSAQLRLCTLRRAAQRLPGQRQPRRHRHAPLLYHTPADRHGAAHRLLDAAQERRGPARSVACLRACDRGTLARRARRGRPHARRPRATGRPPLRHARRPAQRRARHRAARCRLSDPAPRSRRRHLDDGDAGRAANRTGRLFEPHRAAGGHAPLSAGQPPRRLRRVADAGRHGLRHGAAPAARRAVYPDAGAHGRAASRPQRK